MMSQQLDIQKGSLHLRQRLVGTTKRLIMVFSLILIIANMAIAEPVRDRILGNIDITESPECSIISIGFNFPVRYLRHFPYESGSELRIKLEPIAISQVDRSALFKRESYNPEGVGPSAVSEIIYEGDVEGGPFLTLIFRHSVRYTVEQGSDFRSVIIMVEGPEALHPCSSSKR